MKKKGDTLEVFVEHLYKNLGKKRVKRNIRKKKGDYKAQIDVQFGLLSPSFVECKNYAHLVPYEEFMKFVGVCETFHPAERIMVTTADFDQRCYLDRHKYGVELINHHKLRQMYHKAHFTIPRKHINASMTQIVREKGTRGYKPSIKRSAVNFSKWGLFFAMGVAAYEYHEEAIPFLEETCSKAIPLLEQTRPYLEQAQEYIQTLF